MNLLGLVVAVIAALLSGAVADAAMGLSPGQAAPSVVVSADVEAKPGKVRIALRGLLPTRCWSHVQTVAVVDRELRLLTVEPWKRPTGRAWCPAGLVPFEDAIEVALAPGEWRVAFAGFAPTRLAAVP